jgi:hypothetical protein
VSTDPAFVRAQINEAEKRAGARQVRLLIVALIGLGVIAAFAVAGFFLSYSQARKNGDLTKRVIAQGMQIKKLGDKLIELAQAQAESSANGRTLLVQQAALTAVIADQTSSTTTARQQAQVAGYLQSLVNAQKTLNADQLRKLGQLAVALGAPPAAVNEILAEPVPVITFGPPPAASPAPLSTPTPTRSVTVSPTPSRSPFLQVQCPIICPQPPK